MYEKAFLHLYENKRGCIVCKHQIKNNNGPNIDPCGTPHFISTEDVFLLLKLINCFRLFR